MLERNLLNLQMRGVFIYCHFEKNNLYILHHDHDDNGLYLITANSDFTVQHIDEINNSQDFINAETKFFTKPSNNRNGDVVIKGFYGSDSNYTKFEITDSGLVAVNTTDYIGKSEISKYSYIDENYDVRQYIQFGQQLFIAANDRIHNEAAFFVYDTYASPEYRIDYLQSFYSDNRDIYLNSFSYDKEEKTIYVVGSSERLPPESNIVIPFFQKFNLPNF